MSRKEKAESLKRKAESRKVLIFLLSAFCCLLSLYGCTNSQKNDGSKESSNKFKQYYVQGEKLYHQHCSNCHQKDGSGLGRLYPPLNKSDYMDQNFNEVLCLMRHGIKGELVVNDISFNQPMPGIPTLTDLEIAEIATYIYNSWENEKGIIDVKDASQTLEQCNTDEPL